MPTKRHTKKNGTRRRQSNTLAAFQKEIDQQKKVNLEGFRLETNKVINLWIYQHFLFGNKMDSYYS